MKDYNVVFTSQSKDAGESMPLGGRDIGCNVWVEKNSLYLYMAQSGAFDEYGNMIKAGRLRIDLDPNPFEDFFRQELKLKEGFIKISARSGQVDTLIDLWVDIRHGAIHIEIDSSIDHKITAYYENWRTEKNSYKYPSKVIAKDGQITFYHKIEEETHFINKVREEGLESIAHRLPNVQKDLVSGGRLVAEGMVFKGKEAGEYAGLACDSYLLEGRAKRQELVIYLHLAQPSSPKGWEKELKELIEADKKASNQRQDTLNWWSQFWDRSYVHIRPNNPDENDIDWQMGRNYQLFRYMLACNAYGKYPSKFNGGLFIVDPPIWGARFGAKSPDERDWGGIVFTAQNQRHLYWPMLKSGDFDMMTPQFDFYFRLLEGAKARSNFFFGVEDAACIPEQVDANGLSAFYGKDGLDWALHVRYHYGMALDFGFMMLKYIEATGEKEVDKYIDFIATIINFYDQMYDKLDDRGKRIIFPSTAQETYHKVGLTDDWADVARQGANYNEDEVAVTNPADLIYALRAVLNKLLEKGYGNEKQKKQWETLRDELPPIPLEQKNGHTVIAPCEYPKKYYKINSEFPQLYPCYPFHEIGIGESNNKDLKLAIDTYYYGWDEEDQLGNLSWQHVGVFAARLGLVEEAYKYQKDKLKDSGRRFPAFWGPGYDYVPDHNWGGTGMTGIQEMLVQNFDGRIYLLPAWPKGLDVEFKLWVENMTYVEVSYLDGRLDYRVSDRSREKDIVVCI